MAINEGNYGEKLYRVTLGTGFAFTKSFEAYAYHEQEAVDLVADYVEEHHQALCSDHYELADLCRAYETVDEYAEANGLTCCGNHGIYLDIVDIKEIINYDDFIPSWYIYTDSEGIAHSETFGQITEDQFFTKVSKKICFDDLDDSAVQKIYYKGKEVEYAGWQPCMKYEYKDLDGNTVWVGYFEEWDH